MSGTSTPILGPDEPVPPKFEDAYRELQAISAELKPTKDRIPDVDRIEPLVRRAKKLAEHCQARIDAVRGLVDGTAQAP
ncbi:exodeoxyribonuclease VII small subunit [Paracraurococcus lichenis]|uniref:Exodeoxyribonuclease VII small subunit n=1 Tax=Paracraurococcus lichenis TaxID=3064888 RepID=A0ABT9EE97_9PROT|nr:exodeoxyribonuclease VII small subunit [Paracraurococcus sp. LOR1-02]MDO9714335.1 exodeoxyribonuclease VII small subunit [Paracraurococcus sp. LOR1-02]